MEKIGGVGHKGQTEVVEEESDRIRVEGEGGQKEGKARW